MATAAPPPDPTGLPPAAGSLAEEATVQQQTSQHPANELGLASRNALNSDNFIRNSNLRISCERIIFFIMYTDKENRKLLEKQRWIFLTSSFKN